MTRLIRISVDLSMEMRVGCLVTETARVMVQYATMVRRAKKGRRIAACKENDCGAVSSLLEIKILEIKERRRLEMPDTSMRWAMEISFLLQ